MDKEQSIPENNELTQEKTVDMKAKVPEDDQCTEQSKGKEEQSDVQADDGGQQPPSKESAPNGDANAKETKSILKKHLTEGPATEPIGNDVVDESNVKKNEHNKEVSTKATDEMGSAKEKDDSKESPNSGNGPPEEQQQLKPKSAEDKQFEENVKFLYRSHQREPGKRRVKPNLQLLEMDLNIPEEDSEDDSDYKVEGDEDVDNSDPGSEAGPDDEDTADENTTDTDSSDGSEEKGSNKVKKGVRENGESPTALDKAKLIAEKALELNGTAGAVKILICNICLGDRSAESDEIVECDSCGVTVHEGCYGVSDSDSVLSTGSSASTEPWFCDSCKAGVLSPNCELCPNSGGIFKETDAGRWVHLVCALYTPGCAFGSVEKLTPVTLFEMQYSKWGQRACHLCEDGMMARTGVTISCDAGMCRISFHVTCAQRMGLLSDANPEYIADPFYAHCKVHVDKSKMKMKKKNWSILQHQERIRKEKELRDEAEGQELSKEKERVLRKLNWLRDRYATNKATKAKPWLPTQKMPRLLHSSSTAIEKFRRKAELYGLSHILIAPPEDKRIHGQPAFSADFVAYFLDRQRRFTELEKSLEKNIDENTALRKQQALMNQLYEKVSAACKKEREDGRYIAAKLTALWSPLKEIAGLRCEPRILEEKRRQEKENGNAIGSGDEHCENKQQSSSMHSGSISPQKIIKSCKVCGSSEEPHQQIECEQCRSWFHLFCLQPPLTRFPKKSKGVNWLCEDCLEANRVQTERANALALSTSRRSRGQSSRLARELSIDAGEESGSRSARGRPVGKKRGRKPGIRNKEKQMNGKDETTTTTVEAESSPAEVDNKDKELTLEEKEIAANGKETMSSKGNPESTKKETNTVEKENDRIVEKEEENKLEEKQEKEKVEEKNKGEITIEEKDKAKEDGKEMMSRESDAETEDDLNPMGIDEEDDEPSREKKQQPVRGGRRKRKGASTKGTTGGKKKRSSAKEKEIVKEGEDRGDADGGEQQEEMDIDEAKETDEGTKKESAPGKECSPSKRETGGSRDKHNVEEIDETRKKEEQKGSPSKNSDKPTDQKHSSKISEDINKETASKESPSSGTKSSVSKGSASTKDTKESPAKDSETKSTGSGRKERESGNAATAGDNRKHCVKCNNVENTNQIVICDECGCGVHWACLDPPVKKNPKPRGYTWNCDECEALFDPPECKTGGQQSETVAPPSTETK